MKKKLLSIFLIFAFLITFFVGCTNDTQANQKNKNNNTIQTSTNTNENTQKNSDKKQIKKTQQNKENTKELTVKENGAYTSKEEVALYIHKFSKLPSNFIKKSDAQNLGWESSKGNLDKVAKGKSIGGDRFSNREKTLPTEKNRKYFECDINYKGGFRGSERIVFSNDGLVYYTNDHYKTFTLLYGEVK